MASLSTFQSPIKKHNVMPAYVFPYFSATVSVNTFTPFALCPLTQIKRGANRSVSLLWARPHICPRYFLSFLLNERVSSTAVLLLRVESHNCIESKTTAVGPSFDLFYNNISPPKPLRSTSLRLQCKSAKLASCRVEKAFAVSLNVGSAVVLIGTDIGMQKCKVCLASCYVSLRKMRGGAWGGGGGRTTVKKGCS